MTANKMLSKLLRFKSTLRIINVWFEGKARTDLVLAAEPLRRRNRARGIQSDPLSTHPPYARDSLVPWHIGAAAWEAVDQP